MVARLKPWRLAACAVLWPAATTLHAEPLQDPTRPPASLLASSSQPAPEGVSAVQLQSVLLGKGRTPAAVISGEVVMLGGRFRDGKLVRVTERSAVIRGPQGDITLALLPDTNRQGHSAAAQEPTR